MAKFSFKTTPADEAEREVYFQQESYRLIEAEEREARLNMFRPEECLRRVRQQFGKSQSEMAVITEASRRAYQSYESGEKPVPGAVLYRVSAHFDIDLHELVAGQRSPVDSKSQTALHHEAIHAFRELVKHFSGKAVAVTANEMAAIAAQLLKWKRPSEKIDVELIEGATRAVTGSKYLPPTDHELFNGEVDS